MKWFPFGTKDKTSDNTNDESPRVITALNNNGVEFYAEPEFEGWLHSPTSIGSGSELILYLGQLLDEGYAEIIANRVQLRWPDFYRLANSPEHNSSIRLFGLPPIECWRPVLASRGTFTDPNFAIVIDGWITPEDQSPMGNIEIRGAVITSGSRSSVLTEEAWLSVQAIQSLRDMPASARKAIDNQRAWAAIRSFAIAAKANMADFLRKTVVLTPDRLRIDMRKNDSSGGTMVEVLPGFDGAPERWLEIFDRMPSVPDRYEIPDGNGIVHVLLSPQVQNVLGEIHRMPGRRVAGARAEAFLRNPFATLGPDASETIDPEQFEQALETAGISFSTFTVEVRRDDQGFPYQCALLVQDTIHGVAQVEELRFQGPMDMDRFLAKLETQIAANKQCCHWEGYDLEILGNTPEQAAILRDALSEIREVGRFKTSELFDLSNFSDRIEGFGIEKPYYSPFIARRNSDGEWFPENVDFGLCFTPEGGGETVAIILNAESMVDFREAVIKAQEENRDSFPFPGCPQPVPTVFGADALTSIGKASEGVNRGTYNPNDTKASRSSERKGLIVKPNVKTLDYVERRGVLTPSNEPPELPSSLLPGVCLKDHQLTGVAWLQHLWRMSPSHCSGALLADDMGLGKTIQLLTFIASVIEQNPRSAPFLIVAPVSLLENWKEEIAKFFKSGTMDVLTLYGPVTAQYRVPQRELEEDLINVGATKLLKQGWLGSAQVVLTTYETLRDLEFSLARQRWSAMICDEAQKIKNPNALVTRAAKKQNARLKIACTGTPVENTLTDIWCLFDFIQPGLLGALKDFGERYRKPIEAETDDEKRCIEQLRALIEPQKLRRMKADVAKDLPKKIEVESCRTLSISDRQRSHYASAITSFRRKDKNQGDLQSPLALLQYLRLLCSDPRPFGHGSTDSESIASIELHSPKMSWLMGQLRTIEEKGEKAIVFCEFRHLQRTLQRAVRERFGFLPDVINGETSADSTNANNRQRRIKAFQMNPGFGVIILSPLAVGFGVNIQSANHVIHFTRTWNPAKEDQATDRAYRIGQEKDVYVYYPVVVAQEFLTFDAKLDKLLAWKRGLSTDMLNGTGDISSADFGDLETPDGDTAFVLSTDG